MQELRPRSALVHKLLHGPDASFQARGVICQVGLGAESLCCRFRRRRDRPVYVRASDAVVGQLLD
jgi:hypothetical protein